MQEEVCKRKSGPDVLLPRLVCGRLADQEAGKLEEAFSELEAREAAEQELRQLKARAEQRGQG